MQTISLLAAVMCLAVFGCASQQRLLDDISYQTTLNSDCIVILASTSDSESRSEFHWILEKNGKSKGTIRFFANAKDEGTITQYEFPVGVYDECLASLEETRFFHMESNYLKAVPGKLTNLTGESQFLRDTFAVYYHGRKHVVRKDGAKKIDDGFDRMCRFLRDVQRRSTVVPTTYAPGRIKRTGAQLAGVTSGLTPAGTLTPDNNDH